jgi:P27 family predicted phage terminase small subunit
MCPTARAEWDRVAPMLEASKVMSPRHQQTLAAYCDAFADMVTADRELQANGTTIMDDKGRVSNHPAWLRKRDARNQMLKFAAEFGLTASALARVSAIEQTPENDEDAAILFG